MKKDLSIKNIGKLLLRVSISFTLMVWLLSKVEIGQIAGRWAEVNWVVLILTAIVLNFIALILKSTRLRRLLYSVDIDASVLWLSLLQLKSNFLRNFLPGIVFSDIYRTLVLIKKSARGFQSISTILIEKILSVSSIFLLAIMSLLISTYWIEYRELREFSGLILFVSITFVASCIVFVLAVRFWLIRGNNFDFRLVKEMRKIAKQFGLLFSKAGNILEIFTVSILIQVTIVFWYFFIARALGFNLPFIILLVIIPLVEALIMLPISVGGLGVREVAFIILFAPFGLTVEDAISFSLLSFFLGSIVRILSGVAFLFELDIKFSAVKTTDALEDGKH